MRASLPILLLLLLAAFGCKEAEETTAAAAPPPPLPAAEALYDCAVTVARADLSAEGKAGSTSSLDEACALAHRAACTNATTSADGAAACLSGEDGWRVASRVRDKRIRQ